MRLENLKINMQWTQEQKEKSQRHSERFERSLSLLFGEDSLRIGGISQSGRSDFRSQEPSH